MDGDWKLVEIEPEVIGSTTTATMTPTASGRRLICRVGQWAHHQQKRPRSRDSER